MLHRDVTQAGDTNKDGLLDYKEYLDLLTDPATRDQEEADGDPADGAQGQATNEPAGQEKPEGTPLSGAQKRGTTAVSFKVEPGPADEIREVIVQRKSDEIERQRNERLRREAYQVGYTVSPFHSSLSPIRSCKSLMTYTFSFPGHTGSKDL